MPAWGKRACLVLCSWLIYVTSFHFHRRGLGRPCTPRGASLIWMLLFLPMFGTLGACVAVIGSFRVTWLDHLCCQPTRSVVGDRCLKCLFHRLALPDPRWHHREWNPLAACTAECYIRYMACVFFHAWILRQVPQWFYWCCCNWANSWLSSRHILAG